MEKESGHAVQLEYILGSLSVGVAILEPTHQHILYANPYFLSLLDRPWCYQGVTGHTLEDVIPPAIYHAVLPRLQQVAATGQRIRFSEVPFEGFLEARGRTYWQISIERSPMSTQAASFTDEQDALRPLIIALEDVTDAVRSRLHLNAIHHISSAIANASALPLVLDRILQALQDMVGSRRCAVFLIDQSVSETEVHIAGYEDPYTIATNASHTATMAAHKNVHSTSQDCHLQVNAQTLLGRAEQERHTLMITDTTTTPDIHLPLLDHHGKPTRPGSVLCVPIFDPYPEERTRSAANNVQKRDLYTMRSVLGTIEVYHRRARSFPDEEIKLLERFAQQAGLAIQNARLFRSIDHLAHAANRQAHQKENIMQAIPDGVVIYDLHWQVADANSAALQLFRWSAKVIGMPIMQAMACSDVILSQVDFLRVPDPGAELKRRALRGHIDQFKLIGANGQSYTLRCSYTPIRDGLGDIFAFVVIYHDITGEATAREHIEAEVIARTAELAQRNEALQIAQVAQELASARVKLLLERLPSGVLLIDAQDTSITLINQRAVQLLQRLGLPLEPDNDPDEAARRAIGIKYESLLRAITMSSTSGTIVPYEQRPFYRALTYGEASEAELHTTTADGQLLHFLFNAAPLRTNDGTITSIILVLHEITTFKALERAREDFFTTMAHELKTPLANIRAHLSALLAKDLQWSADEQMNYLQTADEQVERLVGMVNYFLDASRVEAGALRLEIEPILLPELLEDLQDRLEALISTSQRQLKITLPPQLPAVLGDYELIMRVLSNLLSNAFRYTPEGDTVVLEAMLVFAAHNQQPTGVTLRIIDRGPGISQEQQRVLFTRFSTFAANHRPDADRPGQPIIEKRRGIARWSPATGLGLYISRGIIEAHGSTLLLESRPGEGATFAFTLPACIGEQKQNTQSTAQ